jgi:small subunit ribosomal protein S25e
MGKKDAAADKGKTSKKKEDFWNKPMNKGGKQPKKKWSKARTNEKLHNKVYLDNETYQKLLKEFPAKNRMISVSVLSDKLKVNMSLARRAIRQMTEKKIIHPVLEPHHSQWIFTRTAALEEAVAPPKA